MKGEWHLRDWEQEYWIRKMEGYIRDLCRNTNKIDLTKEDINPFQIREILELLGWECDEDVETTGWEQDMWMRFYSPHYYHRLVVFSCGMTFSLEMYWEDDV